MGHHRTCPRANPWWRIGLVDPVVWDENLAKNEQTEWIAASRCEEAHLAGMRSSSYLQRSKPLARKKASVMLAMHRLDRGGGEWRSEAGFQRLESDEQSRC